MEFKSIALTVYFRYFIYSTPSSERHFLKLILSVELAFGVFALELLTIRSTEILMQVKEAIIKQWN